MPPPFLQKENVFPFAKQRDWPIKKSVEPKIQIFDQNGSPIISDQHWGHFSFQAALPFRRNEKRRGLVSVSAKLTLLRHGTIRKIAVWVLALWFDEKYFFVYTAQKLNIFCIEMSLIYRQCFISEPCCLTWLWKVFSLSFCTKRFNVQRCSTVNNVQGCSRVSPFARQRSGTLWLERFVPVEFILDLISASHLNSQKFWGKTFRGNMLAPKWCTVDRLTLSLRSHVFWIVLFRLDLFLHVLIFVHFKTPSCCSFPDVLQKHGKTIMVLNQSVSLLGNPLVMYLQWLVLNVSLFWTIQWTRWWSCHEEKNSAVEKKVHTWLMYLPDHLL